MITTLSLNRLSVSAASRDLLLRHVPGIEDVAGVELGLRADVDQHGALVHQAHGFGGSDGLPAGAGAAEFVRCKGEREDHRAANQQGMAGGIFEETIHQGDR